MPESARLPSFEDQFIPHMKAAYNLARWLTRNDQDAEDVVQEAYLRAFRFYDSFRGSDARAWLLMIVRNTCFTWLAQNRKAQVSLNEEMPELAHIESNPETILLAGVDLELLRTSLAALPIEFREAIVLRELEGLSYKEISAVTGLPLGTVMSRLARARTRLQQTLAGRFSKGGAA